MSATHAANDLGGQDRRRRSSAPPLGDRDPAHPDFERWKRGADAAHERGMAARLHLETRLRLTARRSLDGLRVLDLGCGSGSAALALADAGCRVTAADISPARLAAFPVAQTPVREGAAADAEGPNAGTARAAADGLRLPFRDGGFEAVVLQDVIEHLPSPRRLLDECARVLVDGGFLYLSTPNRESLINYVSDPHWGLPRVARLRGERLRRAIAKRRPTEAARVDLACLLSLGELLPALRGAGFTAEFLQRATARMLFERPGAVVWSRAHLRLVAAARRLGLAGAVRRLANDRPGFMNRWISPAWYVMAVKHPPEGGAR